jgi:tetrahydromethanopterin S-methyltransferase subunit B
MKGEGIFERISNEQSKKLVPDIEKEIEISKTSSEEVSKKESTNYMPSELKSTNYGTARGVAGIMSFLGWVSVILGVVAVLMGFSGSRSFGGMGVASIFPGTGLVVSGMLLVSTAQITR